MYWLHFLSPLQSVSCEAMLTTLAKYQILHFQLKMVSNTCTCTCISTCACTCTSFLFRCDCKCIKHENIADDISDSKWKEPTTIAIV